MEDPTKEYCTKLEEIVGGKTTITRNARIDHSHFLITRSLDRSDSRNAISRFELVKMPGCCGVVVSTGAYVYPTYRTLGIGTLLNEYRMKMAQWMGFSIMLCTDIVGNTGQEIILKRNEWEEIHRFCNKRTGNNVAIHVVNIP